MKKWHSVMTDNPLHDTDARGSDRSSQGDGRLSPSVVGGLGLDVDLFHTIVFPNNVRALRRARGFRKLLELGPLAPQIPYVRLSKIERGEVVPRVEELLQIASALDANPKDLLIDLTAHDFDMREWASEQFDPSTVDHEAEVLAVILGAAIRYLRASDRSLTPSRLESDFDLTPPVVSRLENGLKPLARWNDSVQSALCRMFNVADQKALVSRILALHEEGVLEPFLPDIRNPDQRRQRTAQAISGLLAALDSLGSVWSTEGNRSSRPSMPSNSVSASTNTSGRGKAASPVPGVLMPNSAQPVPREAGRRLVTVHGSAMADGLVARTPTNEQVEVPSTSGPDAWAMRVCWQSLGAGLPGRAVVIVDPDRFPSTGGLAVVREDDGYRLLAVKTDRQGRLRGYSDYPARDILIDELPPADVATVIIAVFE